MVPIRTPDILVVAAMKEELNDFKHTDAVYPLNHSSGKPDKHYWELPDHSGHIGFGVCGVGKKKASKNLSRLLKTVHPELILLMGYSGAIIPSLNVGDLVIIEKTIHESLAPDEYLSMNDRLISRCQTVFEHQGVLFSSVSAVSSDTFIDSTAEKKRLHSVFGAGCVDMESHAIARIASHHNIPILIIRVISDLADETIGLNFSCIPAGKWAFRLYFACRPWLLPGLFRLFSNARRARRKLSNAVHIILDNQLSRSIVS